MIPVVLAGRTRAWRIAGMALLGCLAGALAGYLVGSLLYDSLGRWLLEIYGYSEAFAELRGRFQQNGAWFLFIVGVSPIPLQIGTIGAGLTAYPPLSFLMIMALARGLRYFGLAALLWLLGDRVTALLERHGRFARLLLWAVAVLLAGHALWQVIA